jgi:hypothetical protein
MKKHHIVDHNTELKHGDFVIVKGEWAEIYHITEDNGIHTSKGWICRSELQENWQPNPDIPIWIVCAACRHRKTQTIFCSARHFDTVMRSQIKAAGFEFFGYDQGFIDQYGRFYNRKDAWVIAEKNNQITRKVSSPGRLYSENMY